jgi:hypothetical protein
LHPHIPLSVAQLEAWCQDKQVSTRRALAGLLMKEFSYPGRLASLERLIKRQKDFDTMLKSLVGED